MTCLFSSVSSCFAFTLLIAWQSHAYLHSMSHILSYSGQSFKSKCLLSSFEFVNLLVQWFMGVRIVCLSFKHTFSQDQLGQQVIVDNFLFTEIVSSTAKKGQNSAESYTKFKSFAVNFFFGFVGRQSMCPFFSTFILS